MKKTIVFLFIAAGFCSCGFSQTKPAPKASNAKIEFVNQMFDFGNLIKGNKVSTDFVFKNTGTDSLYITKVQSSCPCLVSEWPKTPVPPGQTAKIKATFNANESGIFNETITITHKGSASTDLVTVKAYVLFELQASPSN